MIPKTLLQTSKNPYPKYVKDMWDQRVDRSWTINWFDDDMIIEFFKENPLSEFPNVIDVFYSFFDGGHRADLFRYYYLYLNGGFFIDSDCMSHVHMNDIYSNTHDHILVTADVACNRKYHPEIDSPIIFNGFMACVPGSKIVYDALKNAYKTKPRLLEKQRLYFVYMLYAISQQYRDKYNILSFTENQDHVGDPTTSTIDHTGRKIMSHYFACDKVIPVKVELNSFKGFEMNNMTFFTTFNDVGYNLYGKAWTETFIKLAEHHTNLRAKIYYENFEPDILHNSIEYVEFNKAIPDHSEWKQKYLVLTDHGEYTRKQVVRFSHKAFVIQHALESIKNDYVIWLDGDCIFTPSDYTNFPSNILDNKLLACQVEEHAHTTVKHVESGILIFNPNHVDKDKFVETFRKLYQLENIMAMPNDCADGIPGTHWEDYGPYDGFIVHKTLATTNIDFVNLNSSYSSGEFTATPEKTFVHPQISTKFIHNIGNGKINYTQINRSLGIDADFEWSIQDTENMIWADPDMPDLVETNAMFNNNEFPFTVYHPKKDRFISADIVKFRAWEPRLSKLIIDSMKPGGIFVDIGANIGWHSKIVQNAGYNIIAFEPQPQNFEVLKINCTRDGDILYNLALGEKQETLLIERDFINYGNSFISNTGTDSVQVVKLDDMINDYPILSKICVVKIDVQGFETKVIQGGISFFDRLEKGTGIIIEVSPTKSVCNLKIIAKLIKEASKSYAMSFWTDDIITVEKALATCRDPRKHDVPKRFLDQSPAISFEFDMVLIK